MSRVVIPQGKSFNTFHLMKLVATYREDVLETSIRRVAKTLFPDCFVIPFKTDIATSASPEITKRPDLAMIDRRLKFWGVIEAEVIGHSLDHVLEQVNVFVNGDYNSPKIARYIKAKLEEHCDKVVSLERIERLIAEEAPQVLVIADELRDDWNDALMRAGAQLCCFELYKNTRGLHLFRTTGRYPVVSVREAHVRRHATAVNLLEVTSPFQFRRKPKNKVTILFERIITEWDLLTDGGKQFLRFAGGANPLMETDAYVVFADRQERYYFRRN